MAVSRTENLMTTTTDCNVFDRLLEIILAYRPQVLAIEAPFLAKCTIDAEARRARHGYCSCIISKIPVQEYSPKK